MKRLTSRRVAFACTATILLSAILFLGTCVAPRGQRPGGPRPGGQGLGGERLPDGGSRAEASPAGGGSDGALSPPALGAARPARESAGEHRELGPVASAHPAAPVSLDEGPSGALVVRDAATGELVPFFTLRFRDRERSVVVAATDERGRLEAFRSWLGRGAISVLDDPDLPHERWRPAPDPVWRADHYELSLDVGPTWFLSLTGYGSGEEDALEAWLQVPAGLAFSRDEASTTPVRREGGTMWVRLPAFGPGLRSFAARQTKCLVVRSPREERVGRASVDGLIGRQERLLEIDLEPSYVLRGRVRDIEGRALEDASVLIWPEGERLGSGTSIAATSVGPKGRFAVFGLRRRRYSAKFMADGHEDLRRVVDVTEPGGVEAVLVPVIPGEHSLVVQLVGSRGTATLAASLFPLDGFGRSRSAELELEAGRYVGTFSGLQTGRYRLHVEPGPGEAVVGDGADGNVDVTVPLDEPVVLRVEAVETVALHVTLNGRDLDRGVVFYGSEDGREFRSVASISRFGRARLPVAALEYPLWALMDGYQPVQLTHLEPGVEPVRLDLTPRAGWGVFLRVVDGRGPREGILATLNGDGLGLSDPRGTVAVGFGPEESALTVELHQDEAVVARKELVRRPASAAVVEVRVGS